ncbi:MAG: hypothetical protein M1536_01790 [Firmicutes bacterium]|nr:hypothetical protein [Bacillota bacterium]
MKNKKLCIFIVIFMFTLFICFLNPAGGKENSSKSESSTRTNVEEIKKELVGLRGLIFYSEVAVGKKTVPEVRSLYKKELRKELTPSKELSMKETMQTFGFIPRNYNISKFLLDMYTEQVAGFYDTTTKKLYLTEKNEKDYNEKRNEEMMKTMGISMNDWIALHELDHALQDQNFDLDIIEKDIEAFNDDDYTLALKSVIEGEATFVMMDEMMKKWGIDISGSFSDLGNFMEEASMQTGGYDIFSKAPAIFRRTLSFPYFQGLNFIITVKRAGGWKAVNLLYSDVPDSTEQILHPEKYLYERDFPVQVSFKQIPRRIDNYVMIDDNVVGEFAADVFVSQYLSPADGKAAAGGWGGDRYRTYSSGTGSFIIWFTNWDTRGDAGKFMKYLGKVMSRKYPGRAARKFNGSSLLLWEKGTVSGCIEKKGKDVIVIIDAPYAAIEKIRLMLWQSGKHKMKRPVLVRFQRND